MVLRIRLARFGNKRKPVYNIVLAQAKTARNSKPMEVLGTYNPIPQTPLASHATPEFGPDGEKFKPKKYKDIQLDTVRTKYWLGVGAQPSEPVERLLCMIGIMEKKPTVLQREALRTQMQSTQKPAPKKPAATQPEPL